MAKRRRHPLSRIRNTLYAFVINARRGYLNRVWGMDIGEGTRISLSAKLDKTNPRGISVGDWTMVTFNSAILTHDFVTSRHLPVRIGSYCFIGTGTVILPGVTIGDHCVIGAGSLVTRDIPSRSVAVGSPARVVESNIRTRQFGIRTNLPEGWMEDGDEGDTAAGAEPAMAAAAQDPAPAA